MPAGCRKEAGRMPGGKEKGKKMQKRWITQSEYAVKYGISRQAVSKAVKVGRLKRVNGKVDGSIDITSEQAKEGKEDELIQLRKEKLGIEKELAEMKLERTKEEIRQEAITNFIAVLHRKYDYIRKGIAELSLSPEQAKELERLLNEYDRGLYETEQA